jgi:hypothetical protein
MKPGATDYTLASLDEEEPGFGLDAYEPLFFYPQEGWAAYKFRVTLTVPDVSKFYYFCHIHSAMSAEIHVVGGSASAKGPMHHDKFFVPPPMVSPFDAECGTVGVDGWNDHGTCAGKHFLCGDDMHSTFNKCLHAIDCKMHHDMAVKTDADPVKTFFRQMIPHHANAVSMAKVLLKHGGDLSDETKMLVNAIINVQNFQIQYMQGELGDDMTDKCYETMHCPPGCMPEDTPMVMGRRLLFASNPSHMCGKGCVPVN